MTNYKTQTGPGKHFDECLIRERLVASLGDDSYSEKEKAEIAFHMTDWLDDLRAWKDFCEHPEKISNKNLEKLFVSFLIHVPNHLAAASKLTLGVPVADIFEIGALDEEEE